MDRFMSPLLIIGLMLLVATGLDIDADLTWHDQHRIEQIVLLGAMGLGVMGMWRRDFPLFLMRLSRWSASLLVLAFGLGLLSVFAASHVRYAALEWATLFLLVELVLLLAMQASTWNASFDVWASRLVMALAVVIALKIMTDYLAAMLAMGHLDTIMLFEGTFSNRRVFGQVASMVIPLLAYPLLRGNLPKIKFVALFALLALWWMLAIASGTRGTWLALFMAAAVLATWAWNAALPWLRLQLAALALGLMLFAVLFVWLPGLLTQDAQVENRLSSLAGLSGRETLWALAWEQMLAHPWLGIGPMHLAAIPNDTGAHPHNSILQLAAEWGLPATLALMLPVLAGMRQLLRRLRGGGTPDILLTCLTASLLAAAVQSLVDGVIVIPYTQTLLALVAGWALGVYLRNVAAPAGMGNTRIAQWGVTMLSVFALAALGYGVYPEILNRAEATQAYVEAGNQLVPPRYWGVGWIP